MTAQQAPVIQDAGGAYAHTAAAIHVATTRGLVAGRQVKLGVVRGRVIGYNIARSGPYPGSRYPLLVQTELGIAKCDVDEVVPA